MGEKSLRDRISTYLNIGTGKKTESMKAYKEHIFQIVDKTMSYSVSNHPLPLCMIDSDGKFLWFNRKFADIYQDSELVNTGIYRVTGLKASEFFTEESYQKYLDIHFLKHPNCPPKSREDFYKEAFERRYGRDGAKKCC